MYGGPSPAGLIINYGLKHTNEKEQSLKKKNSNSLSTLKRVFSLNCLYLPILHLRGVKTGRLTYSFLDQRQSRSARLLKLPFL